MLPLNNDNFTQSLPKLNIVIAGDDVSDAMFLETSLKSILEDGYILNVRKIYNGSLALRYLTDETPDLVFLDYLMSDVDGLTILHRLSDLGRISPVILLTASGDSKVQLRAMKFGAYDFLTKDDLGHARLTQSVVSTLERSAIRQDALHAGRLSAIETLSQGVAHEFNNILQVVIGHAQYALYVGTLEKSKVALQYCEKAAAKGAILVKQLNAFAQSNALVSDELTINDIIEEVVNIDRELAEKFGITVNISAQRKLKVIGDRTHLETAFSNLLSNARHACTKNKGAVEITISGEDENVLVIITDNGQGIEKMDMPRVFEPFFTTKGALGGQIYDAKSFGTGLGLAISANIIHRHGGLIDINSVLGKGTTVNVRIPIHDAEPELTNRISGADTASRPRTSASLSGVSILIVDDEQMIGKLVSTLLTDDGFVCEYTTSAKDMLSRAASRQYDLLLLDLTLPGELGGKDMLKTIRSTRGPNRSTPALAMTGHGPSDFDTQLLAAGFSGIIRKPFDMKTISGMISDVLFECSG